MKLILQAIKSLLNKINIRLAELENKTSDENISDGKFLPDGTPYFELVPVSFPETTGVYDSTFAGYTVAGTLKLVEGSTYTVTYNGVKYNCKCVVSDMGAAGAVKGFRVESVFALLVFDTPYYGVSILVNSLDGASSVTIAVEGVSKLPHKLPENLLPNGYTAPLWVTLDFAPDGSVEEVSHTWDNLKAALNAKRDIIIAVDEAGTNKRLYRLSVFRTNVFYFHTIEETGTISTISWKSDDTITKT